MQNSESFHPKFRIPSRKVVATLIEQVTINRDEQRLHPEGEFHVPEVEKRDVEYPDSDGKPMGETGFHVRAILQLYSALCQFFLQQEDVYVAADMFLYYEEEGVCPCVVFEVTSKSSMIEDMVTKSVLYAMLGVREYFLFDPLHEYLENTLVGFRLEKGEYVAMFPDTEGRFFSEELGVLLSSEHDILRVIDPQTGEPVPSLEEAISIAEQEAQRAERLAAQLRAMGIKPEV
jgi:hypothetical protein